MPFPDTSVLDNFNRSENPLSTNWSNILNSNQCNGSAALGNNSSYSVSIYGTDFTGAQEVWCEITTKGGTGHELSLGLMSKDTGNIATIDGYSIHFTVATGTDTWSIDRADNGVPTVLASGTAELVNGDIVGLRLMPNGDLQAFRNGSQIGSTINSTTYTGTGKLSLTIENTTWRINAFGGGLVPSYGVLSVTQAGDALSATGTLQLTGAVSVAQDDNALSSTGTLISEIEGTATLAQDDNSLSSTSILSIVGSLAQTQAGDSLSSAGAVSLAGALAQTQESDGVVASGVISITGELAVTQEGDSLTASGAFEDSPISGEATITQGDNTVSSAGTVAIAGTFDQTQGGDSLVAEGVSGAITFGVLDVTQDGNTITSAGILPITGTTATILSNNTIIASGALALMGVLNVTQANNTLSATNIVTPEDVTSLHLFPRSTQLTLSPRSVQLTLEQE
jgi:hypothetical protein